MFVTTVEKSNKVLFENLAPEELLEQIELPECFVLGAIEEDGEGVYAAGILVFEVWEGTDGEEDMIVATLEWLYVAEEFRKRGAADALMQELFRVLDQSGVETIVCYLPMETEYDFLCAYLEAWGFRFTLIDKYEVEVPLGSLTEHSVLKKHWEMERVVSLSQVPSHTIKQSIQKLNKQESVLEGLERYLSLCDMDVSCAVMEQDEVMGMTLIRRLSGEKLEILVSRSFLPEPKNMLKMLSFAAKTAGEKYPADTLVKVVVRNEAAAKIVQCFFPEQQPLLVRRGFYSLTRLNEEG